MLYYLSQQILDWAHGSDWESRLSFLRLFKYITVRSAGAAIVREAERRAALACELDDAIRAG